MRLKLSNFMARDHATVSIAFSARFQRALLDRIQASDRLCAFRLDGSVLVNKDVLPSFVPIAADYILFTSLRPSLRQFRRCEISEVCGSLKR